VGPDRALCLAGEGTGEAGTVRFDQEVDVPDRPALEEVPHRTSDEIDRVVTVSGDLACQPQELPLSLVE
jgi:hypothetical protein